MIAEEKQYKSNNAVLTGAENTTLHTIYNSMQLAVVPFKQAYNQPNICRPLNENGMTQIFVEQVDAQIQKGSIKGLGVKNQYSDIFFGTKGIPDFYFHKVEEGITHLPLLVVEVKRLPVPDNVKKREKEYVIGNNNNGGIERFKTEKHGKGLEDCGMIGFVEKETFIFWQTTVNHWITELSEKCNFWQKDELLNLTETTTDFAVLNSIAHQTPQKDIHLHHLWINLQ